MKLVFLSTLAVTVLGVLGTLGMLTVREPMDTEGRGKVYFGVQRLHHRRNSTRANFMESAKSRYHPLRDIFYNSNKSNGNRAVFVVPRRAYYDNRLESGKPRDVVVVLAEVHDNAVATILACELDGKLSREISVLKENSAWIRRNYPKHTHCLVAIQCLGLPQDVVFNGSIARVIYKRKGESFYSRVVSEKPLFLHEGSHNPSTLTKGRGSIVVCTTTFGHPDRFDQWLMYQKHLGVEQVHIQAHASFADRAHEYPFLKSSLKNGFARMEVWNDIILSNRTFYLSQKLKYQDCQSRYIGVFEFGLFCDYDDFFNPVIPKQKNIHYYLAKFFSAKDVGSFCLLWTQMTCAPIKRMVAHVPHGNLTSILSGYQSIPRKAHKCIHRMNAPLMVSVHTVVRLLGNYRKVTLTRKKKGIAYVAHVRISAKQC